MSVGGVSEGVRSEPQDRMVFAVAMLLLATLLAPLLDSSVKYLTATLPVLMIATGRYLFQAILLWPIVAVRHPSALWRMPDAKLQLLRSLVIVISAIFFFSALRTTPLADEAGDHRAPPPDANTLPEHPGRECGDDERIDEEDRDDIGER
ncbi:MAG: hypothetical protein AAFU50_09370, partial [Pseudomonadota bacterium]